MTREEEICKAAEEFAFSYKTETSNFHNAINDFYYGAKWADKTMIDKACKWIENYVENAFTEVDGMMIELHGIELSEDFRKSMEEMYETLDCKTTR